MMRALAHWFGRRDKEPPRRVHTLEKRGLALFCTRCDEPFTAEMLHRPCRGRITK